MVYKNACLTQLAEYQFFNPHKWHVCGRALTVCTMGSTHLTGLQQKRLSGIHNASRAAVGGHTRNLPTGRAKHRHHAEVLSKVHGTAAHNSALHAPSVLDALPSLSSMT